MARICFLQTGAASRPGSWNSSHQPRLGGKGVRLARRPAGNPGSCADEAADRRQSDRVGVLDSKTPFTDGPPQILPVQREIYDYRFADRGTTRRRQAGGGNVGWRVRLSRDTAWWIQAFGRGRIEPSGMRFRARLGMPPARYQKKGGVAVGILTGVPWTRGRHSQERELRVPRLECGTVDRRSGGMAFPPRCSPRQDYGGRLLDESTIQNPRRRPCCEVVAVQDSERPLEQHERRGFSCFCGTGAD